MQMRVSAKFAIERWDESHFDKRNHVPKVTRAVVDKQYAGDIDGSSTTEWLMVYAEDGSAKFVGLERISGFVGGREGSLVLQHVGMFEAGAAKGVLDIVEGAGSGELRTASGTGEFVADPSGSVTLDLSLD